MKKKTFWIILIILVVIGLLGCSLEKRMAKYCPMCPQKDSIVKTITLTETIRDTIIKIKPDSSIIQSLLMCDSLGNVYIKNIEDLHVGLLAKPKIVLKNNIIRLKCVVDTQAIFLRFKERYKESNTNISKTKIITTNKLTKIQKAFIYMGRILVGLFILLIIYFIYLYLKKR